MSDKKKPEESGFGPTPKVPTAPLQDPFVYLMQRNQQQQMGPENGFNEMEVRKRLFQCSRSGNLPLMIKTLALM
jgi:hypothetical protein